MTSTIFPAHGSRRCVEVSAWRSEIYAQEPSSTRRFLHPGLRNVREKLVLGWCREGDSNPHNPFGSADFKSAHVVSYLFRFPVFAISWAFVARQSAPKYAHAQPSNDHDFDHDSRLLHVIAGRRVCLKSGDLHVKLQHRPNYASSQPTHGGIRQFRELRQWPVAQEKGRSCRGGLRLCAVVNGGGYFQAQFNPNTKQRACFFHTPYNQSAFQPMSWFAGERVASGCDIRASVLVLSDRKAKTAQYGSTRKAATRAGACEGYIHLRDSLLG
jgi:hypothetical protein